MSDAEYVCEKCGNIIPVDYWDWSGGDCSKCGAEWFWDEDQDYEHKWPAMKIDGKYIILAKREE